MTGGRPRRTARSCLDAAVADLRHMTATWDGSSGRVCRAALPKLLQPRFRVVLLVRASQWAWDARLRPLAYWLQGRAIRGGGTEIHPGARIGPGLCLVHSVGIVVGRDVVAGPDLVLHQGVTLGHGGSGEGQPRLGRAVRLGAGAVVLGPVRLGDGARVGANAVVLDDVPAGATATGVWPSRRRHSS